MGGMVGYSRLAQPSRRATVLGLGIVVVLGLVAAYASILLSGTKTGAVLALATTIGPALLYVAIIAPLSFPFGLYAALVPLDGLLGFTQVGTITRIVGLAAAGAMLLYMLRTKKAVDPARQTMFWVLFYLWAGASLFWALDPAVSQEMLPTELQLFALYLVAATFPVTMRGLQTIVAIIIASTTAVAAYGVYAYHSGGISSTRLTLSDTAGGLNPDHYGGAMILPIALAIAALLWSRSLFVRAACCLAIVTMLWAVELTGARGAALALGALFVYLLVRDRTHRIQLATFAAVGCAIVLAATGGSMIARFAEASVSGGSGRMDIWHVGLLAFQRNWLVGAGYNNFPLAFDQSFLQVSQSFFTKWHRASHNILLHTGVELGSIGLILFVLAWVGQFRLATKISAEHMLYPMRLAAEGALIGLFVAGLFADIMTQKYVWLGFMVIALIRNAAIFERKTSTHA